MPDSNDKLDLDADLVRKMAKLLEETGLREIEYSEGEKRIRVSNARSTDSGTNPAAHAPCSARRRLITASR